MLAERTHPVKPYDVFRFPEPRTDGIARPTVITWIKAFKMRNSSDGGSIRIDRKELMLKNGLHSGKAVSITGVFYDVSIAWFAFSESALNICGGVLDWPDDWPSTTPSSRNPEQRATATDVLIKVPKAKFQGRPRLVTGISSFNWDNEPPRPSSDSLPEHEFYFVGTNRYEGMEQDDHVFSRRVLVCHNQCITEVSLCWVAIASDYDWERVMRVELEQQKANHEEGRRQWEKSNEKSET